MVLEHLPLLPSDMTSVLPAEKCVVQKWSGFLTELGFFVEKGFYDKNVFFFLTRSFDIVTFAIFTTRNYDFH